MLKSAAQIVKIIHKERNPALPILKNMIQYVARTLDPKHYERNQVRRVGRVQNNAMFAYTWPWNCGCLNKHTRAST